MVISELQFGLACPESCFKATKLDVWLASMSTYLQSQSTYGAMRLSDAIDTMLKAELTAKEAGLFQHTNLVNLFTIASGTSFVVCRRVRVGLLSMARCWLGP